MKEMILAFVGSLCPAVLFNVERNKTLWVGLSGTLGWMVYAGTLQSTQQVILCTFLGAVMVGFYSEFMARLLKCPATVFSVSGIFPLVPGIGGYQTAQMIVENRLADAAGKGIETLASAGAIAIGIMLMSAVFKVYTRMKRFARQKRQTRC